MSDIEVNIKNTVKGHVHEILVGYYFLNKFPAIKRPFATDDTSEKEYNKLIKDLSNNEIQYLHRKAHKTARLIKRSLRGRGYKITELTNIYWTHGEKDVSFITGLIDHGNPSDILLEFGGKEFIGMSLKTSCSDRNRSTVSNYSTTALDSIMKIDMTKILKDSKRKTREKSLKFGIDPEIYTQDQLRLVEKTDKNYRDIMFGVSSSTCKKLANEYTKTLQKFRKDRKKRALKKLSNMDSRKVSYFIVKTKVDKHGEFFVNVINPKTKYLSLIDRSSSISFQNNPNTVTISVLCDNIKFGDIHIKARQGAFGGYKCNFTMDI